MPGSGHRNVQRQKGVVMANRNDRQNIGPNKSGGEKGNVGGNSGRSQMSESELTNQSGRGTANMGQVSSERPSNIKGGEFSGTDRTSGRSSSSSLRSSSKSETGSSRSDLSSGGDRNVGQGDKGKGTGRQESGEKGKANLGNANLGPQGKQGSGGR
jgi:hypothetical protein